MNGYNVIGLLSSIRTAALSDRYRIVEIAPVAAGSDVEQSRQILFAKSETLRRMVDFVINRMIEVDPYSYLLEGKFTFEALGDAIERRGNRFLWLDSEFLRRFEETETFREYRKENVNRFGLRDSFVSNGASEVLKGRGKNELEKIVKCLDDLCEFESFRNDLYLKSIFQFHKKMALKMIGQCEK
jgi:hypothetical protein